VAAAALPRPGRCVVMGVLNVTPDSFSDGGRFLDRDAAVAHGIAMYRRGADLVDVGGESTRPGAPRVDADIELARVLPVVTELAAAGVPVSVDTTRSSVAAAAVSAGAIVVNDVSGGLADPAMAAVVADAAVPWILMHWRGRSEIMDGLARYRDVVADVLAELLARVDAALAAGVAPDALVIDPGLGFAKTAEHNWALLGRLDALVSTGLPVLVGASRKRFLGSLLAGPDGSPRPPDGREVATAAVSALAAAAGAWGVRVHDVGASLDAVAVAAAWAGVGAGADAPAAGADAPAAGADAPAAGADAPAAAGGRAPQQVTL
jgi:dihydropteroate synthase